MHAIIGTTTYDKIKGLTFAPQTDLTGDKLPINEVQLQIHTTDSIAVGGDLELYDDLGTLWCNYKITYAEHHDLQTLTVRASSALLLLERDMLPAVMYSAEPVEDVLALIFASVGAGGYSVDASFSGVTVTGFCPEQSARNRLQWVTLVIGAYVKSYFSSVIEVLPLDETEAEIPKELTYWKPALKYKDWVTAVRAYAYTFTQGTPTTTDQWVSDGTNTYIVTRQSISLSNPDAPAGTPTHEVTVDELMLINDDNVDDVLSHLSTYYFKRASVEASVVNNAAYLPGDLVKIYTDTSIMAEGFIESAAFRFGQQAMSQIVITPVDVIALGTLIVKYRWNGVNIAVRTYQLPVDYVYSIDCPYFDQTWGEVRRILRPTTATITGTMTLGETVVVVPCEPALVYEDNDLTVISVDDVSIDSGVVTIA